MSLTVNKHQKGMVAPFPLLPSDRQYRLETSLPLSQATQENTPTSKRIVGHDGSEEEETVDEISNLEAGKYYQSITTSDREIVEVLAFLDGEDKIIYRASKGGWIDTYTRKQWPEGRWKEINSE
jgi:hypothetical protein